MKAPIAYAVCLNTSCRMWNLAVEPGRNCRACGQLLASRADRGAGHRLDAVAFHQPPHARERLAA